MHAPVVAILGDSTIPALSLVNSEISDEFFFFYTEENKVNAGIFSDYCKATHTSKAIHFHLLPSIVKAGDIIGVVKEFVSAINDNMIIFVTAGAKQTILPFLIHSPQSTVASLLHSPPRIVIHDIGEESVTVEVNLTLATILQSRGWSYNQILRKGTIEIDTIIPSYNTNTGKLTFCGESYLKRNGTEHLIHKLNRSQKNDAKEADQTTIGALLQIAEDFGRNGAEYVIDGALRSPNKAVLPYYVRHRYQRNHQEEEE
jgi:hypothetical protein